ncbi:MULTISPECIES: YxeA family protein [Listeria]|uniref:YxeA family protein n=1 Tax=Listeria TaxID=1637 RepID=UPI000B596542|nr:MULTISPECIES: YxeA family protein [Listeria]
MKALWGTIITVAVLALLIGGGYYFMNYNHIGADTYYTKITTDGEKENEHAQSTRYNYSLPGFNEDGEKKELDFSAIKNLRKGAYLKIYTKPIKGVTSYEEVQKADIPKEAQEKVN